MARPGSVIGAQRRSFGAGPEVVARAATAFANGLQAGGVAATAKHFPGLGGALGDTDSGAVRVGLGLEELRRVDERPFAALVGAGTRLVMVATAATRRSTPGRRRCRPG